MQDFDETDLDFMMTRVHVSMPQSFLNKVDRAALKKLMSRSDFIRLALMEKLEVQSMFEQELQKFIKPYMPDQISDMHDYEDDNR